MNKIFADIILQDDQTDFGGISHPGETLGEFCEEVGIDLENTSLKVINEALTSCGIVPVFCVEEIKKALEDLVFMYQKMENEYDMNLTNEVNRVRQVIEDIPEAIWKAEHRDLI